MRGLPPYLILRQLRHDLKSCRDTELRPGKKEEYEKQIPFENDRKKDKDGQEGEVQSLGFTDASAKAHHVRSQTSRSAEALLPPHKCGGFHPILILHQLRQSCPDTRLDLARMKYTKSRFPSGMTERKTKADKKGRFKALDLPMPALKRVMFRVLEHSRSAEALLPPHKCGGFHPI